MNINKAIEVLLIEDNPADAYLACEYLNHTGGGDQLGSR